MSFCSKGPGLGRGAGGGQQVIFSKYDDEIGAGMTLLPSPVHHDMEFLCALRLPLQPSADDFCTCDKCLYSIYQVMSGVLYGQVERVC